MISQNDKGGSPWQIASGRSQSDIDPMQGWWIDIWGGVLFLTQAWVLLKWKSTQLGILILW